MGTLKPGCYDQLSWSKSAAAEASSRTLASLSQQQLKGAGLDWSHLRNPLGTCGIVMKCDTVMFALKKLLK